MKVKGISRCTLHFAWGVTRSEVRLRGSVLLREASRRFRRRRRKRLYTFGEFTFKTFRGLTDYWRVYGARTFEMRFECNLYSNKASIWWSDARRDELWHALRRIRWVHLQTHAPLERSGLLLCSSFCFCSSLPSSTRRSLRRRSFRRPSASSSITPFSVKQCPPHRCGPPPTLLKTRNSLSYEIY